LRRPFLLNRPSLYTQERRQDYGAVD
jgi:hypothetical protein